MRIRELMLTSFGKFQNKDLNLKEGVNIIYGNNEAGKTTIHKFIEGMFFGFFNPLTKTKRYIDDYYKYLPWNRSNYEGILKYSYKDTTYRIERNLLKGKDQVKVFDDKNGEDISYMFEYDKTTRLHQPASIHMELNTIVYNNTISVKQLSSRTDESLSKEVKDNLINLGGTLDEDISVKVVIQKLEEKINRIGTKGREKTSPYGMIVKELRELEEEKEVALFKMNEVREYQERLNDLFEQVQELEGKKLELENTFSSIEANTLNKQYNEAIKLIHEIGILNSEIKPIEEYKRMDLGDYASVIRLENSIELIKESIERVKASYKDTRIKLEEINKNEIIKEYKDEEEELIYNIEEKDMSFLKSEYEYKRDKIKSLNLYKILSLLGVVAGISLGVLVDNLLLPLGLSLISLMIFIFSHYSSNKVKQELRKIKQQLNRTQEYERERNEKSKRLEKFLRQKMIEEHEEIERLKAKLDVEKNEKEQIFKKNRVKSIEDFMEGIEKKKRFEKIAQDILHKESLLKRVIGSRTIEDLQTKINHSSNVGINNMEELNEEELEINLKKTTDRLVLKGKEISALDEKINNILSDSRPLADIEEDILIKNNAKEKYEKDLDSLKLARDTIDKISKNIQKDFAPKLNKEVGSIISSITDGKYTEVKISENLDVKVVDPDSNKLIEVDNLSGGTVDQLYFATRFGIIDIIKEESNLPLILDDCFIQYDNERLSNILSFLAKISQKRQIILFTCQQREKELLDNMKIRYNYIELND